jgi:hypothetical protein
MSNLKIISLGTTSRRVETCCELCKAPFDGVTQNLGQDGTWGPDFLRTLAASGWVEADGEIYCGKYCEGRAQYAKQHLAPVRPVLRVNDQSYQRRAAAAAAKGTT